MNERVARVNLMDLSLAAMQELVVSMGQPRYRATQLVQWIHQRGVVDFSEMTDLSKSFREQLTESTEIVLPRVGLQREASDGTIKWLLELHDGNFIEMVYIPEKTRATLCVSSQVGCALNCSFCATGKEGFNRNLSLSEIIGQLWIAIKQLSSSHFAKDRVVTNVVMMGMGEPLLNYRPVVDAMDFMLNDLAYGLSKYRVTLSTSGVIPQMLKLQKDSVVALAVSLHAANDELRNELVPINKKYPLKELMSVCRNYYTNEKKRSVTFEYVMLDGVNDTIKDAKQLARLVEGVACKINLIPFNPFKGSSYETSKAETVTRFQEYLMAAGINTRVRKTRGDDVDAACGQLAGQIKDRTGRHQRWLKTGKLIPQPVVVEHNV